MKTHRYQFVYKPIDRFMGRLRPTSRVLVISGKLLLVASLILFQLHLLNGA